LTLENLLKARKKTVGTKQTIKAIERGKAKVVYVAQNAERQVLEPVLQMCAAKGIPVVQVDSVLTLGKACRIEVGCASAAIVE
jgi:large subunit ribosomal protein L7A